MVVIGRPGRRTALELAQALSQRRAGTCRVHGHTAARHANKNTPDAIRHSHPIFPAMMRGVPPFPAKTEPTGCSAKRGSVCSRNVYANTKLDRT